MKRKILYFILFIGLFSVLVIVGYKFYKFKTKPYEKSGIELDKCMPPGFKRCPIPIKGSPYKYLLEEVEFNFYTCQFDIYGALGTGNEDVWREVAGKMYEFRKDEFHIGIGRYPFFYETLRWEIIKRLPDFKLPKQLYEEISLLYEECYKLNEIMEYQIKNKEVKQGNDQELADKHLKILPCLQVGMETLQKIYAEEKEKGRG